MMKEILSPSLLGGYVLSRRPHPGYICHLPCINAVGDADEDMVPDVSGRGAHATLQTLTPAEAWANPKFLTSIATPSGKSAIIPLAFWPHRFIKHALLISIEQEMAKPAGNVRVLGNGVTLGNGTGFAMNVTSAGALQPWIGNGGSGIFGTTTSSLGSFPYASAAPTAPVHWGLYYEPQNSSFTIYVNGVRIMTEDTAISRTVVHEADSNVLNGYAIGGRPTAGGAGHNVKTREFHAIMFEKKGIPNNLDKVMRRLYRYPAWEVSEKELDF